MIMRRGYTLNQLLMGVAVMGGLILLVMILFPTGSRTREQARRSSCQSNLKQIMLAALQYSADYDERLPFNRSSVGWAQNVQPYARSFPIFQCPSDLDKGQHKPRLPGYTDYWMNSALVGHSEDSIVAPKTTILLGDGDGSSPLSTSSYSLATMPSEWQQDSSSPAQRHLGGSNYAFADGHVKFFKPDALGPSWHLSTH